MQSPFEIAFVDTSLSPAVEADVRKLVAKLDELSYVITNCHVFMAAPRQNHHKGNQYELRIEVGVPGTELAVGSRPGNVEVHEDVHVAVRAAEAEFAASSAR